MTMTSHHDRFGLMAPILDRAEMRGHTKILLATLAFTIAALAVAGLISAIV